jgi:hypothetical protein
MLGIYILSAILGGGLLVFSLLAGAHHDMSDVDVSGVDMDTPGFDAHVAGVDVAGADVEAGALQADHDIHIGHDAASELVLGLFRPRNIIFFLTGFGITGSLLTWSGTSESLTLGLALGMGGVAWLLTHGLFTWLRRSESVSDALSEREIEGRTGRVVLPLAPGEAGRVVCLIADHEHYLTARLASDIEQPLKVGSEVIVLRVEGGVAEVIPFDTPELLSGES